MDQTGVMPPFQGDEAARAALAAYLMSLHGRTTTAAEILETSREAKPVEPPQPLADTSTEDQP
jgi:mono/diheme cytochrome c family protein